MRQTESSRWIPVLVGAAALGLYGSVIPTVSGTGDAPEFTVALATGGLVHPSGYPIYTMTGHAFARLVHALGASWPLAANLWSAVGAALAVFFFVHVAARVAALGARSAGRDAGDTLSRGLGLGGHAAAVLVPTLLLVFNPILLAEATQAEVNAWSLAWTCGIALFYVVLIPRIEVGGAPSAARLPRAAAAWGFLCGLGLAHHLPSVLVSAPLTVTLIWTLSRRGILSWSVLVPVVAGALLPILSYAFVAWRAFHPAPAQWPAIMPTWGGIGEHILAHRYRQFIGYFAPDDLNRILLAQGAYPFIVLGMFLLLLAGARARSLERRVMAWGLLAAAACVTGFTLRYGVYDPAPYFLPAVALSLLGVSWLVAALWTRFVTQRRSRLLAGTVLTILLAPLMFLWFQDAQESKRYVHRFERDIRSMWAQVPPDTAIVLWPADQWRRLSEYQVLRGEKRALFVMNPELLLEEGTCAALGQRFGADPFAGFEKPAPRLGEDRVRVDRTGFLASIVRHLNDHVAVPVYWFDPSIPVVAPFPKR